MFDMKCWLDNIILSTYYDAKIRMHLIGLSKLKKLLKARLSIRKSNPSI